jgi:predicted Zn-ribbon and HTH transcriptional regulator
VRRELVVPPRTRRQEIRRLLTESERSFDELRQTLRVPVKVLEEDLRHLDKSLRGSGQRLVVGAARCGSCGFSLRRRPGRFATPSRCPKCRNERLAPCLLAIDPYTTRGS